MKKNKLKWIVFLFILVIGAFSAQLGVLADDDDDDERGYYEENGRNQYEDEEDEDKDNYEEEDGYYEEDGGYQQQSPTQKGYWNFWIREAVSSQDPQLPITSPSDVKIKTDGLISSIHVVPRDGQLLVPGDKIAKLMNAKVDFYEKSRILVITKNNAELIVRAGSNAAYENKNKTPMPIQAQFIEKSLYIPISVAANSLGYRVFWNEAEQSLVLENLSIKGANNQ